MVWSHIEAELIKFSLPILPHILCIWLATRAGREDATDDQLVKLFIFLSPWNSRGYPLTTSVLSQVPIHTLHTILNTELCWLAMDVLGLLGLLGLLGHFFGGDVDGLYTHFSRPLSNMMWLPCRDNFFFSVFQGVKWCLFLICWLHHPLLQSKS